MKRYTFYFLFLLFVSSMALSQSLIAQRADIVKGFKEIPVGPPTRNVILKVRNGKNEAATDFVVCLSGGGNITRIDIRDKIDFVDDDYLGTLDEDEDDQMVDTDTLKPYARTIIPGQFPIHGQDSVCIEVDFDVLSAPGATLTVSFSTENSNGVHASMAGNTALGLPGVPSTLFLAPGSNGVTTRLVNETGEFISAVGVVLPEQPLEQLFLEAPYENSEIPLGTGRETMIFFNPPLAPFDQARLYVHLPQPLGQQGAEMQFITLESFPSDCPISISGIDIDECEANNTFGIAVEVNVNAAARRCKEYTFTNSLNQSVNDLHAIFSGTGGDLKTTILRNAPGCGMPAVNNGDEVSNRMDIVWPAACVDPGESVRVRVCSTNGTPRFEGGFWTLNGQDVGALKEEDVSPGPEYGAGSDGLEYYLDGELVAQSPTISGTQVIENIPASEEPVTLFVAYAGVLGCEIVHTLLPPTCNNQFPLDCERMHLPDQDIPLAEYPIRDLAAGTTITYESLSNPITDFWVIPPEMPLPENAYQCGRDYRAVMDQPQLPATSIDLTLDRSGPYLVRYQTVTGDLFTEIIYVDTESPLDPDGNYSCATSTYKFIPCGDPDLAVLSSTDRHPNRWGDAGKPASSIDAAAELICSVSEAEGKPLCLVINVHGSSGTMQIGDEFLTIDNVDDFAEAIKGKVAKLTIMSCNVAMGERGREFVCALEQKLGVNVTAYTGVVGVTTSGEPIWVTSGEPYSWEDGTTATNDEIASDWTPPALVYPNPFSTSITLQILSSTITPMRLRLFRADGSLVREELHRQSPVGATYEIQLTDEPAGIYFLQVEVNGSTSVQRMVKTN